jgi:hypothetical protein
MNEATALAPVNNVAALMPVMSVEQAVTRYEQFVGFVSKLMREGSDFGTIPGTNKPTLLKPGAEKLTTFFGLTKRFELVEKEEDWTGERHGNEPFFNYLYRCSLFHGSTLIAESDGSCNSWESKYRWRKAERTCPQCGAATIIKGKAEYGGGWLCFAKKGGCGAKYLTGDESIESQQVGRVPNPDIFDQINTFQKMASKRALIAATLLAVNASEFFTQDMEDFAPMDNGHDEPQPPRATNSNGQTVKKGDSGKLRQSVTPAVPVSEEERQINEVLIDAFSAQKGDKNGPAFFAQLWAGKSLAERRAKAEEFGYKGGKAAPVPASQQTIDAPVIEDSEERHLLLADIEDLFTVLKDNFGRTDAQIAAEVARQTGGECEIERLDTETLTTLKTGLTIYIQQLRKS